MSLDSPATPEGVATFMKHRYHTADPWKICERLNIGVHWADLPSQLLGRTAYFHARPVIMLNSNIHWSPKAFAVLAHELGHAILHEGVATYYHASGSTSKMETQADKFACTLLTYLYAEEFGRMPETVHDLECEFGVKYVE